MREEEKQGPDRVALLSEALKARPSVENQRRHRGWSKVIFLLYLH